MVYRKSSLIRRIEKLKEYNNDLYSFDGLDYAGYLQNKNNKYAIERILFLVSENILDFLDHILSAKFHVISDSYEEILENAFKRAVIDEKAYDELRGLGGFRNVLAHEYLGIDDHAVFEHFCKIKRILPGIIGYFEELL